MSSKLLVLFKQPSRLNVLHRKSQSSLRYSDDNVHFFIFRWHPIKRPDGVAPTLPEESGKKLLGGFNEQEFADELHRLTHERLEEESSWLFKIYAHKTYLDADCISYLSLNRHAFSKEKFVCNCTMFVPVVTWGRATSVLGTLEQVREEADTENDFLQVALAMIYLLETKAGRVRLVLPILRDEGGGRVSLRDAIERLSSAGSKLNSESASCILQGAGVKEEPEKIVKYLSGISVRLAVMKLLSNSSRGDLGLDACPGAVSGACGWYMVERDMGAKGAAKGAVEMISNHLVKELREQVVEKVWHFEKHNPRGMEMLQVLQATNKYQLLHEFFALRSIDSLDRLSAVSTTTSTGRTKACEDSENPCERINKAKEEFYDEAVEAIGEIVKNCAQDQRFLPLNTRLSLYRDDDVDGILALRSSNSLETALLKTPAQCCIAFGGLDQMFFGAVMVQRMLATNSVFMVDANSKELKHPKTVQVSRVIDSFLAFLWGVLYLSAIAVSKYSTPLNAKRVLVGSMHLILWLKIVASASDFIQCDPDDAGFVSSCSGLSSFVLIACILIVIFFVHFVQHYAWIVVFLLHGAYCLRDGLTIEENTKHVFLVLGVLSWLIVIVIVVRYSLSYRQTFKELHIAMEGFEKTWDRVVSKSSTKLDEISNEVLVISLKLKAWTTREASLWERVWSRLMGRQASRYSVRSNKIRQHSKSLEKLFEEAHEISAAFQLWVGQWNPMGRVEYGKVKSCERAIQKTVRSYHRDPSCLTDLVRCTVVVKSIEEVLEWVRQVRSMSAVAAGLGRSMLEELEQTCQGDLESGSGVQGDVYLNITSIKNRYDRKYDFQSCGGYRDLCVCFEVGWTVNAKSGACTFIPLKQWDETQGLRRHICEVQVLLDEMYNVKQHLHKQYVNFRNVLCQ